MSPGWRAMLASRENFSSDLCGERDEEGMRTRSTPIHQPTEGEVWNWLALTGVDCCAGEQTRRWNCPQHLDCEEIWSCDVHCVKEQVHSLATRWTVG